MRYTFRIARFVEPVAQKSKGDFKMKLLGCVLLFIGVGSVAFASVPEISPASAGSAIALISGAVLVMRGRRKK
jgi:hypothetical protein